MMGPKTRVLGLVTADSGDEWLVRLFNALYGFNGLDAAYLPFVTRADALGKLLDGFRKSKKAEAVHIGPSLWAEAAAWARAPLGLVDALHFGPDHVTSEFQHPLTLVPVLEQHLFPGAKVAWVGDERVAQVCLPPLQALEVHVFALEGAESEGRVRLDAVDCLLDASLPGKSRPLPGTPRAVLAACDWRLGPATEAVQRWSILPAWIERAVEETRERFAVDVRLPKDLDVAVTEKELRPCQLNDDAFRSRYEHLKGA